MELLGMMILFIVVSTGYKVNCPQGKRKPPGGHNGNKKEITALSSK